MNIKKFTDEYFIDRKGTNCYKWDNLVGQFGEDELISMWVADMDFKAPKEVCEAISKRVEHGVFGYTMAPDSYHQSFIDWQKKRHDFDVKKEWIRFTPGVVTGIYWCVQAFTNVDDSIIINTPVYYPFHNAVKDMKRNLVCNELINNDGLYSIDFSSFEKQIIENNVKIYILCSPHNPVGRVWKRDELEKLMEICSRNNVLVISDEIHQDIVFGNNKHIPTPCIGDGKYNENIITLTATSKTFNLAGLKNSFLIIPSENNRKIFDDFQKYPCVDTGCLFGYIASDAAYRHGEEWLNNVLAVIYDNYELLCNKFRERLPLIKVTPLEGTFLAWIDLREYVPADKTKHIIQDKCKIAVDYGDWFGEESAGFIRINLATSKNIVETAVDKLIEEIELSNNLK